MARPRRNTILPALLLPLLGGCSYFEQRLADLGDTVLWRWHDNALGVAVDAKVGPLAACLGGWYADFGQGKDTFWQAPGHVLTNHGTGVPFTTLSPLFYGTRWSRFLATSSAGNHPADPNAFDDTTSWLLLSDVFDLDDQSPFVLTPERRISDLFGIEVGVVPVFVSLHVGFNLYEFADALLGFVLLDIGGDDGVPRPPTLPFVPREQR
ncbi:MAG: hypothetical protein WAT39_24230 [Planctomycetota bacterium]